MTNLLPLYACLSTRPKQHAKYNDVIVSYNCTYSDFHAVQLLICFCWLLVSALPLEKTNSCTSALKHEESVHRISAQRISAQRINAQGIHLTCGRYFDFEFHSSCVTYVWCLFWVKNEQETLYLYTVSMLTSE